MGADIVVYQNTSLVRGLLCLGGLGLYYVIGWLLTRDKSRGAGASVTTPPLNLSPAAIRYVYTMGLENNANLIGFVSNLVDMSVKQFIQIREKYKVFTIEKMDVDASVLSPDELIIAKELFNQDRTLKLEQYVNFMILNNAINGLENYLSSELKPKYFPRNYQFNCLTLILCSIAIVFIFIPFYSLGMTVFGRIIAFSIFAFAAVTSMLALALSLVRLMRWRKSHISTIFAPRFHIYPWLIWFIMSGSIVIVMYLYALHNLFSPLFLIPVILIGISYYASGYWMKPLTSEGKMLMSEIMRFKSYLSGTSSAGTANNDLATFERLLPYSIALGVHSRWVERFLHLHMNDYTPVWYSSDITYRAQSPAHFSTLLADIFREAVSIASRGPGRIGGPAA